MYRSKFPKKWWGGDWHSPNLMYRKIKTDFTTGPSSKLYVNENSNSNGYKYHGQPGWNWQESSVIWGNNYS